MAVFKAKIKKNFSFNGIKGEAGLQVELTSKQSSIPNLLSAGKQDVSDAFKRAHGVTFNQMYITVDYLEITMVK
jgi:hypothetical protein